MAQHPINNKEFSYGFPRYVSIWRSRNSKIFVAEFIGTLSLVYIGAGSAALGIGLVGVALAFAFIVAAVVYTFGNISGAQINPAVSISLWAYGALKTKELLVYLVAQFAGAIVGALLIWFSIGTKELGLGVTALASNANINGATINISPISGMLIEVIVTFILVITVYGSAVGKGKSNFAGLIIGLVVAAVVLVAGPLTNCSINPARSLGPALVMGDFKDLWVYLVGPVLGGLLAVPIFKYLDVVKEGK